MDPSLLTSLSTKSHIDLSTDLLKSHTKKLESLISTRQIPNEPWSETTINLFLSYLSSLDCNNGTSSVSIGEREGRIYSHLVSQRNYHLSHGIGRSGDITASQPKAAGSTVISHLTSALIKDLLRTLKIPVKEAVMLPLATGMGLMMILNSLRLQVSHKSTVIWIRCDQKSAPKAIVSAGFKLVAVELTQHNDELFLDLDHLDDVITNYQEDLLAVVSTTSCFAPRAVDDALGVGRLCRRAGVYHVSNFAYGFNSESSIKSIKRALNEGCLDLFVFSTDKNFLVPVGGCVVAGNKELVDGVSHCYPGRASISPLLDVMLTFLSMGKQGYLRLLAERSRLFDVLKCSLASLASELGERVLDCPNNNIAIAMTLNTFSTDEVSKLGSMLYKRGVSGARTVGDCADVSIGDVVLKQFGHHFDHFPHSYLHCASSVGITDQDVDGFISKLRKCIKDLVKKRRS
ncbi:hypothetical protein P9112_011577 [Eukaryota sp. TZLM1-RC]